MVRAAPTGALKTIPPLSENYSKNLKKELSVSAITVIIEAEQVMVEQFFANCAKEERG